MPVAVPVACRKGVNPVAEAVVVMRVIEAVRRSAVEIYEVAVTRMLRAEVIARRPRLAMVVVRTGIVSRTSVVRSVIVRLVIAGAVVVRTPCRACRRDISD